MDAALHRHTDDVVDRVGGAAMAVVRGVTKNIDLISVKSESGKVRVFPPMKCTPLGTSDGCLIGSPRAKNHNIYICKLSLVMLMIPSQAVHALGYLGWGLPGHIQANNYNIMSDVNFLDL